ncbi:MarR family winged helix-turn-helix transcriptional regulator [Neoaquamicrobium sediminum]|uniref:MarR family winged helix-turn-helix transcriptional regulator n=1 Tax=Neoaquamicrobium sediminum TaxID=1849104 RepID=UPI0015666043|nr:MarR family transcriptional regulator [Mesorhizobium sediminum]NRC54602.1 MarR family transcriptional regulator [Mesorhizobium sediminum]
MSKPADSPNHDTLPFATTLHVRDKCLCLHLQRAARATARMFDEALRPIGITSGQFSLLMSLNRPAPPLMGEIAAFLAMDRTTLTAMLKPLQRRGLLEARTDEADRRGKRLVLLPEGHALLARAVPVWARKEEQIEALLIGSDPERLRQDLVMLGR